VKRGAIGEKRIDSRFGFDPRADLSPERCYERR
jgi:hypothetical protein